MIVDVGLSPFTPLELSTQKRQFAADSLTRAFFDAVFAHATIVIASEDDLELLREVVTDSALTPGEKTRWQAALEYLKKQNRIRIAASAMVASVDEIAEVRELLSIKGVLPFVGVLAEDTFVRLFADNHRGVEPIAPDASVATGTTASESDQIISVRDLAEKKKYPLGTPRDQIWGELFQRIASVSSRVAICDRFLLKQLAQRDAAGSGPRHPEHITWFMEKLDQTALPNTRVSIYTELGANGVPASAEGAANLIARNWKRGRGRLSQLELVGAPNWIRRTHPHNRHVRFGSSFGFKLDEGLDRLDAPRLDAESGFAFTYRWRRADIGEMSAEEQLVRKSARSQRHILDL